MRKRLVYGLFSYLIYLDVPSSKRNISGYNHHRELKFGSIELYGILNNILKGQ